MTTACQRTWNQWQPTGLRSLAAVLVGALVAAWTAGPGGVAWGVEPASVQTAARDARPAAAPATAPRVAGAVEPVGSFEDLDPYSPHQEVQGTIQVVGSTTMQHLVALWAEGFGQVHPKVELKVDCRGSETVLPSLAKGQNVLGAMTRVASAEEQKRIEQQLGCSIVQVVVCHDAVGILVNKDNPIQGLSVLPEVPVLRSVSGKSVASTWGELGLTGEWAKRPIHLLGPSAESGIRAQLERLMLGPEAGQREVGAHDSRAALIEAVTKDKGAITAVSLSRGDLSDVRVLPVAGADHVLSPPTEQEIASRHYPLIRPLYLLLTVRDGKIEDPLLREFLSYVLSRSGQHDAVKDGFLSVSRSEVREQEHKLGWARLQ